MSRYAALKEECCEGNRKLPLLGLVDLTFGNLSVIDRAEGIFAIKPSGVPYGELSPDDMVVLNIQGNVLEGRLRPSSDTPTHLRLFQAFPHAGSIVHSHSRHATSFAQAGQAVPCLGTTHADYFYGEVPVTRPMNATEIAENYEWETGNVIVERFQSVQANDVPAVLVHGHGPFVWGANSAQALENSVALEIVAEMAWRALQINPQAEPISPELLEKHFRRKHGPNAYYGQTQK